MGGGGGCLNGNLSLLVLGAAGIRLTKTTSKMALPTPILKPEELNIRTSHRRFFKIDVFQHVTYTCLGH